MNTNQINKQLLDLYQRQYQGLAELILAKNETLNHTDRATNPLLIQIDSNYSNADFKVMVFGQETNTWLREMNDAEFLGQVEPVYQLYSKFFLSNNCYGYGGQFWNGVNRFMSTLKTSKGVVPGLVRNNVLKIGRCRTGAPFGSIQDILFGKFNVISEEIEILKTDLLLFLSGPNYDGKIKRSLGQLNRTPLNGFTDRQLCRFNLTCGIPAFRTYHPNYLWRNDIDSYFEAILKEIKTKPNTA